MDIDANQIRGLIKAAFEAREKAYAPYSGFMVGAALISSTNEIYKGCNIENAAYSPTNCAERTAVFKAVSEGVREFNAIAIVGGDSKTGVVDYCAPCGVCRQVLLEFVDPEKFMVIMAKNEEDYLVKTLAELLPLSFKL